MIHVIMFLCLYSFDVITEFKVNRCGKLCKHSFVFLGEHETSDTQLHLIKFNFSTAQYHRSRCPHHLLHSVILLCLLVMFVYDCFALIDFDLNLFVCLFELFVCLLVCLNWFVGLIWCVGLFVGWLVGWLVCWFVCLFLCFFVSLFLCFFVCLFVCFFVCLFV